MSLRAAFVLAACLVVVSHPLLAGGGDIRVTPIVTDGRVSATFSAPAVFSPELHAVVQSGLLVTFTFTVEMRRGSGLWLDHTVANATVAAAVKFDNLTGVYQVSKSQDGHVVWSDRTSEVASVRKWMTDFERVPLTATEPLESNVEYYLQVRMRASPKRTFSLWPFSADDGDGRASFTFIR